MKHYFHVGAGLGDKAGTQQLRTNLPGRPHAEAGVGRLTADSHKWGMYVIVWKENSDDDVFRLGFASRRAALRAAYSRLKELGVEV